MEWRFPYHTATQLVRLSVVAAAVAAVACGSTATQSITAPAGDKCAVSVAASPAAFEADGGIGTVAVDTQPECAWTPAAEAVWVTDISPTRGQGTGQLQFRILANLSATPRESAIAVNGQRAVIRQNGAACQLVVTPSATRFAAAGGAGTIALSAPAGCPWSASTNVSWVTLTPTSGNGGGTLAFTIAANTGSERSGAITVGGVAVAIVQEGATPTPPPPPTPAPGACSPITINPTSRSISAAATTGISVTVTAGAGCPWTASTTTSWLTIASGSSGSGNGTVVVNASVNSGPARTGTVTIGGVTFTVNQAGNCTPSINPVSRAANAAGSTGNQVAVSASSGCTWTAASNATWLAITAGATGSGNGTVVYSVAANTGPARTGTLTIAGQTFTVDQASGCVFVVAPTSQTIGGGGGSGLPTTVTTGVGCAWTATADASWLHIVSGATGTGAGTVTFTADPYSGGGNSRSGTLTIAGQTVTVTQDKR